MATCFKVSVDSAAHANYGLGYPVTYKFGIPAGLLAGGQAFKSENNGVDWTKLTEKTTADLFNGVECVRFDYTNHFAYISVSFPVGRDHLHLAVANAADEAQEITFSSIPQYYDNRQFACYLTADDGPWPQWVALCQKNEIWTSLHIITAYGGTPLTPAEWTALQDYVDGGYVEVAGHTRTHLDNSDWYDQIHNHKVDLLSHLDLTIPSASGYASMYKGPGQVVDSVTYYDYIPGYANWYPKTTEAGLKAQLAADKFLNQRAWGAGDTSWAAWDAGYGKYQLYDYATHDYNVVLFNACKSSGAIFSFFIHPWAHSDLGIGGACDGFLGTIAKDKTCWYAGYGALYMYHYCQERGQITVAADATVVFPCHQQLEMDSVQVVPWFGSLANVGTWGVDIDLSAGFDYAPPAGNEVNWYLTQYTASPAWDEVNFILGDMLGFPEFVLRTDWIHEAFGNAVVIDDVEFISLADLLIEPYFYTPPTGGKVNFLMEAYTPVGWDEVNWFWPVHFMGQLESVGDLGALLYELGLVTDQNIATTSVTIAETPYAIIVNIPCIFDLDNAVALNEELFELLVSVIIPDPVIGRLRARGGIAQPLICMAEVDQDMKAAARIGRRLSGQTGFD